MKLSCLPVSFFDELIQGQMSVREWARIGAWAGLDAIDLSILFIQDRSGHALTALRQGIEAEGMQIAMITSYPDFTHPDKHQRLIELEQEIEVVQVAAALGAELVRVTAGQAHPQVGREEGIKWAVEGLCDLVEATRNSGVTLVYENHAKPGAWQYTDFSQPPAIFLEILQRTASVNLGVNFDTGNAATFSDDPLALLKRVLPRLISVHASDSGTRGELRHVLLGTGITAYPKIFTCLKAAHWNGWICMEEASHLGREGILQAAEFIRGAWERA